MAFVEDDIERVRASTSIVEVIQQYVAQQDVAQRLEQDETFRGRLEKYHAQYVFSLTQMQNAEIGRIGTQPANMGQINTQKISA